MKKWKIKGSEEFQHLLGRLKSDEKIESYWEGNGHGAYYFNIDNEVLYSDNHEEKQSLTSEHEEVTVEELEQLYYSKSTIEKWSVGSYVVFCKNFTSVCPIGFVDKIITGLDAMGCVHLEKYLTLNINRENYGVVKWFATKQEAEAYAKTLTTVTDMEDFKVGDWIISLIDKTNFRKTGDVFQIVKFGTSQHMIYYTPNTWGDESTFRKALPYEIPNVKIPKQTEKERLLEEAYRRYPVGTKFKSACDDNKVREIRPYNEGESLIWRVNPSLTEVRSDNGIKTFGEFCSNPTIYENGKWAEIVEEIVIPTGVLKSKYLIAAEKALKHFEDAGFYVGCEYESTTGSVYTSVRELTIYSTNSKDCNIDCGGGFLWEYESNGDFDVYGKLLIKDKPQSIEREFQVGDRVECVNEYARISVGMQGVIVEISSFNIGVSWDNFTKGHGCDGNCAVGTGYYIIRDNVRLIGTSFPNTPTSQELNTYGLQVGDTLDVNVLNAWTVIEGNRSTDDKTKWHRGGGMFIGNRIIKSFHLIHGHVGFEVSDTGIVYLKAEGFKEFADSYYPKESKFEMFDIVECVESRGPIKIGMQGVIREINYKSKPVVGVEWFNFDNGHDLDEILQTSSGYRLDYNQIKFISRMYSLSIDYPTSFQLQDKYAITMHQREQLIQKESNQTQELLTLPTNKIYVRKSKSIK